MPRFKLNRWWVLILTLCLGCMIAATMSAPASADPRMTDELGERPGTGGPSIPPPSSGDPDLPIAGCRVAQRGAAVHHSAGISMANAAGDGAAVDGVRMWQLRTVLQGLGLWFFVRL